MQPNFFATSSPVSNASNVFESPGQPLQHHQQLRRPIIGAGGGHGMENFYPAAYGPTGIHFPPPLEFGHHDRALGQPPASTLKYSQTSSVTAIPSNLAMVPAPPPPPHPRRNAPSPPPPPPRSSALSQQRPHQSDAIPPMPQGPPPPDYDATDGGTGDSENGDVTPTKPLMNWTVADVCDWLDSMDWSEYKRAFSRSNVDGHLLSNCDRAQFTQLGVTRIPHQIVMENSLEEYKTET